MVKFECHARAMKNANGDMFARIPQGRKQEYNAVLAEFLAKYQGHCSIRITKIKKPRTTGKNSQSHHLNGHIQQICIETGNDFADVKKVIKQKAIKRGYPILLIKTGVDKLGKDIMKPKLDLWGNEQGISETEADTVECGHLIDESHQIASEFGIVLNEGTDGT